jgi:hypothetical protein
MAIGPRHPLVCIRTVDIPPENEQEFFAWIQSNGCRHLHAVSANRRPGRCLWWHGLSFGRRPLLCGPGQRPGEQRSAVRLRPEPAPVSLRQSPATCPGPVAHDPRRCHGRSHPGLARWPVLAGPPRRPSHAWLSSICRVRRAVASLASYRS